MFISKIRSCLVLLLSVGLKKNHCSKKQIKQYCTLDRMHLTRYTLRLSQKKKKKKLFSPNLLTNGVRDLMQRPGMSLGPTDRLSFAITTQGAHNMIGCGGYLEMS